MLARDPRAVIGRLERLLRDPDEAVRRSVPGRLDALGRTDPALLVEVCTRWVRDGAPDRGPLVRHALRTLVRRGDPHALTAIGYGARARVAVRGASIGPARASVGASVRIAFELASTARRVQRVLVDLRIAYPGGGDGTERDEVLELFAGELAPGAVLSFDERLALRPGTLRTLRPGPCRVAARVNGAAHPVGGFVVVPSDGTAGPGWSAGPDGPGGRGGLEGGDCGDCGDCGEGGDDRAGRGGANGTDDAHGTAGLG